jgi:hypothetical protein
MPSPSQCALVPLACGVPYGGAARKLCIPVSSPPPRAEEPIDEPLAWPIGLSPLLTRSDLSRPPWLCLDRFNSALLCSPLLDLMRLRNHGMPDLVSTYYPYAPSALIFRITQACRGTAQILHSLYDCTVAIIFSLLLVSGLFFTLYRPSAYWRF